eukprot:TRINITY_DN5875_c0_g1_i3.p1 TRINITY_DN5875_c0_g1~~TRINITY_DN5875_c0_g1_i3.p1  ORF type:complete len:777 (+),score=87.11 TRINITY_DN5875_c0_g1_i3:57-2333(+)
MAPFFGVSASLQTRLSDTRRLAMSCASGFVVLTIAMSKSAASVTPFDCARKAYSAIHMQKVAATYEFRELVKWTGQYTVLYTVPLNKYSFVQMGACGISPKDFKQYCAITLQEPNSWYFMRLDEHNAEFIIKLPRMLFAGAFSMDGTYYGVAAKEAYVIETPHELVGVSIGAVGSLPAPTKHLSVEFLGADINAIHANLDGTGTKTWILGANNRKLTAVQIDNDGATWCRSPQTMLSAGAFQSAWNWDGEMFFASNDGGGVFRVTVSDGSCNPSTKVLSATVSRVGNGFTTAYVNDDGLNCMAVATPTPTTTSSTTGTSDVSTTSSTIDTSDVSSTSSTTTTDTSNTSSVTSGTDTTKASSTPTTSSNTSQNTSSTSDGTSATDTTKASSMTTETRTTTMTSVTDTRKTSTTPTGTHAITFNMTSMTNITPTSFVRDIATLIARDTAFSSTLPKTSTNMFLAATTTSMSTTTGISGTTRSIVANRVVMVMVQLVVSDGFAFVTTFVKGSDGWERLEEAFCASVCVLPLDAVSLEEVSESRLGVVLLFKFTSATIRENAVTVAMLTAFELRAAEVLEQTLPGFNMTLLPVTEEVGVVTTTQTMLAPAPPPPAALNSLWEQTDIAVVLILSGGIGASILIFYSWLAAKYCVCSSRAAVTNHVPLKHEMEDMGTATHEAQPDVESAGSSGCSLAPLGNNPQGLASSYVMEGDAVSTRAEITSEAASSGDGDVREAACKEANVNCTMPVMPTEARSSQPLSL